MKLPLPFKKKQTATDAPAKPKRRIVPRVLLCVLLFALLIIPPVFINMAIGYIPVFTLAFLLIIDFVYSRVAADKVEFGLLMDKSSCPRDTDVNLKMRFRNPLPVVCPRVDVNLIVTDIFDEIDTRSSFSFSIAPKNVRDFDLGVRFAHVGTVSVIVEELVAYGPLGIFFRTLQTDDRHEVEILPLIHHVDKSLILSLQMKEAMETSTPFNKGGMDYSGVREYAYGDPLKSIHWKLSSHADDLYTRLFDAVGEPSLCIMCGTDFIKADNQTLMSLFDTEIETALSIYQLCLDHSLRTKIVFADEHGDAVVFDSVDNPDPNTIAKSFPSAKSASCQEGLSDLLSMQSGPHSEDNLVICTASLSEMLCDAIISATGGLKRVVLFYALPIKADSTQRADLLRPLRRLQQNNVMCYALSTASELGEFVYE